MTDSPPCSAPSRLSFVGCKWSAEVRKPTDPGAFQGSRVWTRGTFRVALPGRSDGLPSGSLRTPSCGFPGLLLLPALSTSSASWVMVFFPCSLAWWEFYRSFHRNHSAGEGLLPTLLGFVFYSLTLTSFQPACRFLPSLEGFVFCYLFH